ncbi:MAG: STAS domain-containing protein [Planctomycetes bacterium]|nr:STAS domain-containing protein [Planctomycetota bacterium]
MVDMTEKDGKLYCAFSGRLDSTLCAGIETPLMEKVIAADLPVVFDMTDVEFVSSSFLRLVIQTAKKVGRGNLFLPHLSESVRQVFLISGLDEQLGLS